MKKKTKEKKTTPACSCSSLRVNAAACAKSYVMTVVLREAPNTSAQAQDRLQRPFKFRERTEEAKKTQILPSVSEWLPAQMVCKVYPDVYLYPLFITYYRHIIITSPPPWPLAENTLPLTIYST